MAERNGFDEIRMLNISCPSIYFPAVYLHIYPTQLTMVTKLSSDNKSKLMKFLFSLSILEKKSYTIAFFITSFYLIFIIIAGVSFFFCPVRRTPSRCTLGKHIQQHWSLVVFMKTEEIKTFNFSFKIMIIFFLHRRCMWDIFSLSFPHTRKKKYSIQKHILTVFTCDRDVKSGPWCCRRRNGMSQ